MKLLSRLTIVFLVCLLAIALPATPAQANGAYIALSPSSGVPETEVTVYGYNFTANKYVAIYYYRTSTNEVWIDDVRTDGDGDFRITFTIPESYKGYHAVLAEDEYDITAYATFTVKPGLTVSPEEGPVGTTITMKGQGFADDERNIELRYYLNGTSEVIAENIRADEDGSWEKSFPIPPSTQGNHRIDARGDESSFAQVRDATFEVTPGISIDASSGSVGESITMTGSGFAADERDITILFEGEAVVTEIRADDTGYWEENFEVPEMPKGEYSVTAEGERTQKEDINELSFEIEPGIVLSPDEGHVGMNVTAHGRGFAANEDVIVLYDGNEVATATTDDKGSFEVVFSVPESRHGGRQVTGEDTEGNMTAHPAIFTVESDPPPTPELISPRDGGRVGFAGKVRPTFAWSEVEDVSGVYYSLQISTSANVTATGEFVDPIVTKEGRVGSNYTLEKAEALPHGTYYWIVQTVDGAENAGNWTAVYSFRAGRLPMWAFIVIIVFAVLGAGAAVYFFLVRKRMYL